MTGHVLTATSRWDDGHEESWSYDRSELDASEAYRRMKHRWREAKREFTHDDKTLTLSRRRDLDGQSYTDTLTYEPS